MNAQRMLMRAAPTVAALAGALTLAAPGAQAAAVSCGQVITANTVVTNDIQNCPADGLVIGADGIVLNLNGHNVGGTHSGDGIAIGSHAHVTVKNGRVYAFDNGLHVSGPDDTVTGVTSTHNASDGVFVDAAARFHMTSSWMTDNQYGVSSVNASDGFFSGVQSNGNTYSGFFVDAEIPGVSGTTITQSTSRNNEDGIYLYRVAGVTFTKNTFSHDSLDGFFTEYSDGTGSVVSGNNGDHTPGAFWVSNSTNFAVTGNRATNNQVGFLATGSNATNTFDGNFATGNGTGFYLTDGTNDIVRDNLAGATKGTSGAGGGNGYGIDVESSTGTLISGNKAHGNTAGDGILVGASSSNTTIRRNLTNHNKHDGISDGDTSSSVLQNAADFNANFGIEAPTGTDGGGNEAHGNGAGQCSAGYSC